MKFKIVETEHIHQGVVKYIKKDFSFDTEPIINEIDYELAYNKVTLTVVDKQVVQIWGFSGGDTKRVKLNQNIPQYKRGILMVEGEFEYDLCYSINKVSVQVYENEKTGWFCIGDPKFEGEGVEFINKCIAFIDNEGLLMSLWIKPLYV
ncbi:hypothetical protein [Pedobacter nototheniae]|uniref:hypothetical protein n=1 Tax=Pedobacter nototheniae TaxID=2488994 RepID=UPI002930D74E|nr:hypothetical protein [Pedobacter nototheniae]